MPGNEVFPSLQACTKLDSGPQDDSTIYDVKFYPYATADNEQVFAVVMQNNVIVCRPNLGLDPPFDILRWFRDEQDPPSSYNSLVWSKDPISKAPILCVAGAVPKHIKILDVESGRPVRTLAGHGKGINDLAVSPLSTSIVASGAEDNSIRLWNIEKKYEKQPCTALFAGEGHKSPILAIHFHHNGRWLLSGGIDTAVCLWSVPDVHELRNSDDDGKVCEPKLVYYPHFFTKELHSNYVDCVSFFGDLVISRAARDQAHKNNANEIVIWKIDGFDSEAPVPQEPPIPVPGERTRSAFDHNPQFRGFQRLVTLDMPNTDRFYHRFSLLHQPGMRPILAMGNQQSQYYFWDLQSLEEGAIPRDRSKSTKSVGRKPKPVASAENLNRLDGLRRGESTADASPSISETGSVSASASTERELTLSDPFTPLKPHHVTVANTKLSQKRHFATSQVAWSPDGSYMVGAGDHGMLCIFHRDKSVVGGETALRTDGGAS